jgi:glutathione S-transferase
LHQADAAIAPFLWRFQFILENFRNLDIFEDHPRLAKYFKVRGSTSHGTLFGRQAASQSVGNQQLGWLS